MTQLFGPQAATTPDPATPENRRRLSRELLAGAIRRYEEASREWSAIYESYPPLASPQEPRSVAEREERRAWRELLHQADENFNNAELNLAERIHCLFATLDPAGRLGPRVEPDYFSPRAVRSGGNVYVLAYSAFEYEPKTNIIAVYRESMALDLDGAGAPVHGETVEVGSR
jgi:hypothetical protein